MTLVRFYFSLLLYHLPFASDHFFLFNSNSSPTKLIDYDLGRLLDCNTESAQHEFELVVSGKPLEVAASGRKGKYSMEVSGRLLLLLRI